MYGDKPNEEDGTCVSENDRVLAWTKDVAKSTAFEAPHSTSQAAQPEVRYVEREPPRVIVNQVVTTPAVVVTRARPESKTKDEISTKTVIGTVLGATAGAVVAYAMTKAQTENSYVERPNRVTHRIIEAPVTYGLIQRDDGSHVQKYSRANSKPTFQAIAPPPLPRPHVEELIPRSEHLHNSSASIIRRNVEDVTCAPYVTKVSVADSRNGASHATFHDETGRQSDFIPITEVRSAKDIPLPHSRLPSLVTDEREDRKASRSSVSPKESVSQVSTRRLGKSTRSKHDSDHGSGSGKYHKDGDHTSRTSRTSRK